MVLGSTFMGVLTVADKMDGSCQQGGWQLA